MFDDLRKTVAELDGMKLSVPSAAEPDAEGYIDRQCPAEACEFVFKVDGEDWRDIVRDEAVWCPFCGCEVRVGDSCAGCAKKKKKPAPRRSKTDS